MTIRRRLPARRFSLSFSFRHRVGLSEREYHATVGRFEDGTPAELFVNTSGKVGSEADINASDAAVAVSLALQYGCPVRVIREALRRNPDGSPAGPVAAALDEVEDVT